MPTLTLDAVDLKLLQHLQRDAAINNQNLAERVHVSAPTCLRRVKRLRDLGVIARTVALLDTDLLAATLGHGLSAITEIHLNQQGMEHLDAFEARVVADLAVQQCYRVSPGPDFVLVVAVPDMPAYLALSQRLFTSDANVRNVKSYFSVKRSKFEPAVTVL